MTHKGIQDIEDVSGAAQRDREREREEEEEERIERERQERLKLQAQRQAARASVQPDSPVTPTTPGWGAPPPVPAHALHASDPGAMGRPPVNPLFVQTSSELAPLTPVEQELNLADLINIDDEPGQEVSISLATPDLPPISDSTPAPMESKASTEPVPTTPLTGISPFASRSSHPELASRPSFNLNAIWSPKEETAPETPEPQDVTMQDERPPDPLTASPLGVEIIGEEANDQDFDMFLNGVDEEPEAAPVAPATLPQTSEEIQAAYDAQTPVWSGKVRADKSPHETLLTSSTDQHAIRLYHTARGGC